MTSRERVLAALSHQEPDRVPIDLGGTFVTSIAAQTLHRVRRHLGLEHRPVKVYDMLQMLGEVEMDVVERLEVDVLPVEPPGMSFGLRNENWKPWDLPDGTPVLVPGALDVEVTPEGDFLLHTGAGDKRRAVAAMPKDGFYFDHIGYGDWDPDWQPPALDDLRRVSAGWRWGDEIVSYLQHRAKHLRAHTDKALVLGCWGAGGVHYVGKLVDFWTLLGSDRGYVRELFEISTEAAIDNFRKLWDAIGGDVDVITFSGLDFGTQRSEWFSPETFRETYLPAFRKQFEWLHENTTWKIFEHSCGSLARLVGDLAHAGLDALNPVQTSAAGMDPQWLKDSFGDRLTFWGGGVETQSTLPFGTPEDVRAEVAERMRIFAPGGGFVFNPVHNIQPNTPPANVVAAYDAAREFGRYPIACA